MDEKEKEMLDEAIDNGGSLPETPQAEPMESEQQPLEPEPEPAPRTFTQEEVDRIAGNSRAEGRNSAMKGYIDRYGVESEDELDGLFRNGQLYTGLSEQFEATRKENSELKQRLALTTATLEDGLDPSAYEDVMAIAQAKGMELSPETIKSLMETRPYWRKGGASAPVRQPEGYSAPAPEPAPQPQPQPAPAPESGNPLMAGGGLPPELASLPEEEEAAPAPQPQPQQSVVTRLGGQPHAQGGSTMSPEDMAKMLAGVGK